MQYWVYLLLATVAEVIATSALKATEDFTKFWPTLIVVIGYVIAFYFLTLSLKQIPIGVAYAVWAGLGIVFISLIGWWLYGQMLDLPAMLGIALILAGVLVINLFSKSAGH
ncbi:multidrug transporter [Thiosulfatimonas sediminis]|uniref:Multidrug transporter n=1 Tax=Thiosulfatimonas sediminis TaxID=2675054 RepID=A0A6F8PS08_9GAMM|nr:SMR family transporter [Thiosulfatimonas sediminis]BBP44911.1 multidrug transporter [Thiosulfatimonas sediminis]